MDMVPKQPAFLAKEGGVFEDLSEKQRAVLADLQPLNIEARYPSYKQRIFRTLDKKRCKALLLATKELCQWLQKRLSTR